MVERTIILIIFVGNEPLDVIQDNKITLESLENLNDLLGKEHTGTYNQYHTMYICVLLKKKKKKKNVSLCTKLIKYHLSGTLG